MRFAPRFMHDDYLRTHQGDWTILAKYPGGNPCGARNFVEIDPGTLLVRDPRSAWESHPFRRSSGFPGHARAWFGHRGFGGQLGILRHFRVRTPSEQSGGATDNVSVSCLPPVGTAQMIVGVVSLVERLLVSSPIDDPLEAFDDVGLEITARKNAHRPSRDVRVLGPREKRLFDRRSFQHGNRETPQDRRGRPHDNAPSEGLTDDPPARRPPPQSGPVRLRLQGVYSEMLLWWDELARISDAFTRQGGPPSRARPSRPTRHRRRLLPTEAPKRAHREPAMETREA